jgi:pimeloyl-ACP methyl ester carboxylesterase
MSTHFLWPDLAGMPFFHIAGADIAYARRGEGPTVMLAHGAMGDLRSLLPVADTLADGYATITMSLPALTGEARPERPFGTAGQADDLADLIAALGVAPVHLVAWSYAAHPALVLASRRPELVASLFLYEPGFPTFIADAAVAGAVIEDMMAAYEPVGAAFAAGDPLAAVAHAIDAAAREAGYFDRQPEAYRMIHRDNAAALPALFTQTDPVPLSADDLAAIACPVTVARGAHTRPCYSLVSDAAAALIPGARHVVVESAGHLLPEQDPAAFAALVRAHLYAAGA